VSVTGTKNRDCINRKKRDEFDECLKRERKAKKLSLIVAVVYMLAGIILFCYLIQGNLLTIEPQMTIIALEFMVLGVYALLHASIFYSVYDEWGNHGLLKIIKIILILLMIPYHICLKTIKSFIKDKRQEHVIHLFPYYFISLQITLCLYIFMVKFIVKWKIDKVYNEIVGFVVVFILIKTFFLCGKGFAYLSTKALIKSMQKAEVKRSSKDNWRKKMKDDTHRKERYEKSQREWSIVKEELEYTKIYFYIFLTVLILWIPKESGSINELLSNQFMGITTIAALARETRCQKARN